MKQSQGLKMACARTLQIVVDAVLEALVVVEGGARVGESG